jgi:hypothetical protein
VSGALLSINALWTVVTTSIDVVNLPQDTNDALKAIVSASAHLPAGLAVISLVVLIWSLLPARGVAMKRSIICYDELGDLLVKKGLLLQMEKDMGGTMFALRHGMDAGKIAPLDSARPMSEWQFEAEQVEQWLGPARAPQSGGVIASVAFSENIRIEGIDAVGFDKGLDVTHSRDVQFGRSRLNRDGSRDKDGSRPK